MDITTSTNTQYLSGHHSILGPSRFLPFQRQSWGGPIFNFFGGGGLFHRPMMPGPSVFGYGGGMSNQTVIVNNGRTGFWGGLADVLEGFTRGLASSSWMFGGGMGMPMGMPMGGMYPGMPVTQVNQEQQPEADPDAVRDYNNLKDFGKLTGYTTIKKERNGEYTAYNPKTGDYITGDYETVRDKILPDKNSDAGDDSADEA